MAAPINVIKQGVVVVCFLTLLLSWQQDIFLSVTDICEGFQSKNIELSTRGLLWSSFDVTSWKQYSCVILEQGSRNKSVEYRLLSPWKQTPFILQAIGIKSALKKGHLCYLDDKMTMICWFTVKLGINCFPTLYQNPIFFYDRSKLKNANVNEN